MAWYLIGAAGIIVMIWGIRVAWQGIEAVYEAELGDAGGRPLHPGEEVPDDWPEWKKSAYRNVIDRGHT